MYKSLSIVADEVVSVRGGSPIIDVERLSSDDEVEGNKGKLFLLTYGQHVSHRTAFH